MGLSCCRYWLAGTLTDDVLVRAADSGHATSQGRGSSPSAAPSVESEPVKTADCGTPPPHLLLCPAHTGHPTSPFADFNLDFPFTLYLFILNLISNRG
jgi:hypothetical protein